VSERVRFLGWVPRERMGELLAAASIFVLASRFEGMPNVVLEAMAYGRPVVCTRVYGSSALVQEGVTGLQADIDDDAQLAQSLRTLLQDETLRARMGAAARQRVADHFTWDATARAYLELQPAAEVNR
jgi:starch synthase (maltosyl-transferring)